MGRRRKKVHNRKAEESDYDSDDERAYKKMPAPDPSARDFYMDEVDEFNENQDKILLEKDRRMDGDSDSDHQEEILPLDYSDSDDDDIEEKLRRIQTQQHLDEIASDIEEDEEEEGEEAGLPDARAWGKRKKEYYNTDYVDDDMPGASGSEEEGAQEEEEREALAIQKRMSQMMQDTDFDLQLFQDSAKAQEKATDFDDEAEEKVVKDLSKLSKREKMEILKKESPEFLELVGDFKIRLKEVIDTLYPLLGLVKDGRIPQGPGADYISTKFKLCMNYCVNISFYMTLKAKHIPVHNHPVIGRILAHKKLIKELEPLDRKLEPEIKDLLSTRLQDTVSGSSEQVVLSSPPYDSSDSDDSDDDEKTALLTQPPKSKATTKHIKKLTKKKSALKESLTGASPVTTHGRKTSQKHLGSKTEDSQEESEMTLDEKKALEYYEKMAKEIQERKLEKKKQLRELESQDQGQEDEAEEEAEDGKRAITYQISKNKGLTPHRKKEQRNPRVKYKMKFKKAKVRRKGQVREVRKELTRYGGEISGIRAGVIKSIKIK